MADLRQAGDPLYVRDGPHAVTVRKLFTGTGERLELDAGEGRRVRLDAIALESVAWQDADEIAELASDLDPAGESDSAASPGESGAAGPERDGPIRLRNEFADAVVETVDGDGRPALSVAAPKLGYEVRLGARELAWLATQDHDRFTEWLETPFGPAADDH